MGVEKIIKRGIIVSCQALEDEPLHSSFIMAKMALAAKEGGAVGIRANSYSDIIAIKKEIDLPLIGIVKRCYDDSEVYITPTEKEVDEIASAKAEIIAIDATLRKRHGDTTLESIVKYIRKKYPGIFLMGDISTYEEGINAYKLGFDLISTTLSGYTPYTKEVMLPDFNLLKKLIKAVEIPVICEGGIWTLEHVENCFSIGAYSAIIGTAITRPKEITERFVVKTNEMLGKF